MTKTAFGKLFIATALTFTMMSAANAYTQEQEAMCTNDAFRVCSSEIPDIGRVTACMVRNRSQLSAGCRAVIDAHNPTPAASLQPVSGRTSKPMGVAPKTTRTGT
jgi:hypothetical protein